MSDYERVVFESLRAYGVKPIPQLAIGPYNCDLACHPVAVEIFGGNRHFSGRHLARAEKRIRYLGNAGWHLLMLVISNACPWTSDTANHLIAYLNLADSDPSAPRQYRVIDGCGELLAGGQF